MLTTKTKVPVFRADEYVVYFELFRTPNSDSQDLYIHMDVDHSYSWNKTLKKRMLHTLNDILLKEYGPLLAYVTNPKLRKFVKTMGFEQIETLPDSPEGMARDIWRAK